MKGRYEKQKLMVSPLKTALFPWSNTVVFVYAQNQSQKHRDHMNAKNAEGDILVLPPVLFSFLSPFCFILLLLPLVPSSPAHTLQYEDFKKRDHLREK